MKRPLVPLAVCFLLVLSLLDHLDFSLLHPRLNPEVEALVGQRIVLEGEITRPLERKGDGFRTIVALSKTAEGSPLQEKMLLTLPWDPGWQRGDRIRFETRIKKPQRYRNPGSFDYRRFLERKGILLAGFIQRPEEVSVLDRRSPVLGKVDHLRALIHASLEQNIPHREAGFLSALVLGIPSGISSEFWEDFRRTGTTHLVAISGQHLGMIALAFFPVLLWLLKRSEKLMLTISVKKVAGLLTLIPVLFYTELAGSPPSAVRAATIGVLAVLASFVGREIDPLSALAAAAIGISLWDLSAPFSASFQLSFLAVLGILIFRRREAAGFAAIRKYLIHPLWMTIGATMLTTPLVAYLFHQVSISGIVTNLWAIPYVGALLILTGLFLILLPIVPPLGRLGLSLSGYLAHGYLEGIQFSSGWSWVASLYPTGGELILSFLFIFFLALLKWKPRLWRTAVVGVLLILGIGFLLNFDRGPRDLEVTFLDVGQGDSALIRTPSGENLLIDGGGFLIPGQGPPRFDVGKEVLVPFLKRLGLKRIDGILLSHPHPDHYGGLQAVLENFPVGEFWWNGQTFPDETFDRLLETVDQKGVSKKLLKAGDRFDWQGLYVEVLYPDRIDPTRNINDNSLVLRFTFGEATLLFSGDIEKWGERALEDSPLIPSTILKIPHHASKTSSSVPFIDGVRPSYAIVSLGDGNFFGFPHPDVLEKYERRGAKVFRTDRHGAVTFTVPREFPRRRISIRTVSSEESP